MEVLKKGEKNKNKLQVKEEEKNTFSKSVSLECLEYLVKEIVMEMREQRQEVSKWCYKIAQNGGDTILKK